VQEVKPKACEIAQKEKLPIWRNQPRRENPRPSNSQAMCKVLPNRIFDK